MNKPLATMSQEEILGCRKWPAWFTVDQMKAQLEWEETPEYKAIAARKKGL